MENPSNIKFAMFMQPSHRLQTVAEYFFSKKLREISELEQQGKKIINLGIGSPDLAPPGSVVEMLTQYLHDPQIHRYQSYQGIPELRDAIGQFMRLHFGVGLDPSKEVLPLIGSKEGITHISLAYLNEGDQVLIPELGYPTYSSVTQMVQAEPVYYPLDEAGNPDWSFFETLDFSKIKLLWINYPHMPTGNPGSIEIFEKLVTIAREHSILLVHDNPYCFILNTEPLSVFQIEGAREVALELHSLSKTFNMSGWRVGWVCGNPTLIQNVLRIKSNVDSGMFKLIQLAAVEALKQGPDWFTKLNGIYADRRRVARQLLDRLDCSYHENQSGLFQWAKCSVDDVDPLIDDLLHNKGIFMTPGHIFGAKGRGYLRISLCNPVEKLEEALSRL
jgi:aspartate/methionine/tyrosine aminotransferase